MFRNTILFFLIFFNAFGIIYSFSEKDFSIANKAYEDGFYEVVEKKLKPLVYKRDINNKLIQEGLLLLAFSTFYQKNISLAEKLLDRLLLAKPLFLEKDNLYWWSYYDCSSCFRFSLVERLHTKTWN